MTRRDIADLLLLGTLWSASFLFMRIAVPTFGPLPMVEVRVTVAAVFLLVILWRRGGLPDLVRAWRGVGFIGLVNTAIPFTLFAWAMQSVTAGFASVLNATSPMFGALIAFLWLRERLPWPRIAGLVIGFGGVVVLVVGKPSFEAGGAGWAIAASLAASLSYGIAPNFTKRSMGGVAPLVIATGSQVAATILVLPFALAEWPARTPPAGAWLATAALGIACTALAYILYFRLIASVGPTRAIAVTFLIPALGMLWGVLFLGETVTPGMLAGCAVILVGTALATGVLAPRRVRTAGRPTA